MKNGNIFKYHNTLGKRLWKRPNEYHTPYQSSVWSSFNILPILVFQGKVPTGSLDILPSFFLESYQWGWQYGYNTTYKFCSGLRYQGSYCSSGSRVPVNSNESVCYLCLWFNGASRGILSLQFGMKLHTYLT